MDEAQKKSPDISNQIGNLLPRRPRMFGSEQLSFPEIEKKLDFVYSHASGLSAKQIQDVKVTINNFLQGQDINLRFSFGPAGKTHDLLVRALMTIYANTNDTGLQIRAKDTVKNSFNPLLNQQLALKIIDTYNKSKYNKFPVKKIDNVVSWALEKGIELNFNTLWDLWIKRNVGPENSYIAGNFIGLVYSQLTGMGGTREKTWFAQYYNDYKENPQKFTPEKAQDPAKIKLDRSKHTVSDIIKYIYNPGGKFNPQIADNFNKANKEILNYLKSNVKNSASWKVFEYVVMDKLDSEEIVSIDKKYFPTSAKVTGTFKDLAVSNKRASAEIDKIYKNNGLKLPSFSIWKTSDLNKAPSDRGELASEKLNELRMLIRKVLMEHMKNSNK